MTVIAYRNGVMAADTSAWENKTVHRWSRKILRAVDGTLYGTYGTCSEGQRYLRWVDGGCVGDEPMPRDMGDDAGSFGVMIARSDMPLQLLILPYGREDFDAPYYAVGGGADVAWGALFAGADAETAVRAAIEHSDAARGDVQVIRF